MTTASHALAFARPHSHDAPRCPVCELPGDDCGCPDDVCLDREIATGAYMAPPRYCGVVLLCPALDEARELTAEVSIDGGPAQYVRFADLSVTSLRLLGTLSRLKYRQAITTKHKQLYYRRWQAARLLLNEQGEE